MLSKIQELHFQKQKDKLVQLTGNFKQISKIKSLDKSIHQLIKRMGPKRKPKDDTKKAKNTKSQNQVLLFQYFPKLNQNKNKTYQNILSKPNAVFKEEKKLSKQILTEQNQVIKEINNLFREVFQSADHEDINRFGELFRAIKYKQDEGQNGQEKRNFSRDQEISKLNFERSEKFVSPAKRFTLQKQEKQQDCSSVYTRTVTVKRQKRLDLTDFEFHESKYKQKEMNESQGEQRQMQKVRCERKYSETYISPENTITISGQVGVRSKSQTIENSTISGQVGIKSKSQTIENSNVDIDWTDFEFNPLMASIKRSTAKRHENIDDLNKKYLLIIPINEPQIEETLTIQPNVGLIKNYCKFHEENTFLINQLPQFNSVQHHHQIKVQQKTSATDLYELKEEISQKQSKISQIEDNSFLRLQFLDINCQSSLKKPQTQKDQQAQKRLKEGINKIIELIDKKQKAKQQEINFRKYIQEVKQKQIKSINCINLDNEQDLSIDQRMTREFFFDQEKICSVQKYQDPNNIKQNRDIDILDCILHRESSPQFGCYFEDHQDEESQEKQINYQIKDYNSCFNPQTEDQVSTKEQSQNSNTISSSRFINYIDSLQPSFTLPDHYLIGYSKETFNPKLFRQIHDLELQKAHHQTHIRNKII